MNKEIQKLVDINQEQLESIRKILSGFKKYNPKLVPICGSINAVILFLELQWLRDSFEENHGVSEFYHTDQQLKNTLMFERKQLDNAKKKLSERGLISYRVLGNRDRKTYYQVHVDKLMEYVLEMYEKDIPKCTKGAFPNVPKVHTKKNNKQDLINKTYNNKATVVDNWSKNTHDNQANPCGAVPLKNVNFGNRTGLFLRLREVEGISEKTVSDIFKKYEDYQISNVLDSAMKKRGIFQFSEAAYILGALKKTG